MKNNNFNGGTDGLFWIACKVFCARAKKGNSAKGKRAQGNRAADYCRAPQGTGRGLTAFLVE